jgi:hypothetical protein
MGKSVVHVIVGLLMSTFAYAAVLFLGIAIGYQVGFPMDYNWGIRWWRKQRLQWFPHWRDRGRSSGGCCPSAIRLLRLMEFTSHRLLSGLD